MSGRKLPREFAKKRRKKTGKLQWLCAYSFLNEKYNGEKTNTRTNIHTMKTALLIEPIRSTVNDERQFLYKITNTFVQLKANRT